jgi:hypothetical protein
MTTKIRFPTLDEIRCKAYQIYLARDSGHCHDLDDWLQAEYELMQLPLHKIAELEANAIGGQQSQTVQSRPCCPDVEIAVE